MNTGWKKFKDWMRAKIVVGVLNVGGLRLEEGCY